MLILKTADDLKNSVPHSKDKTIGFVPTMGALHEGHLSLLRESKAQCDLTVCSIFVNPTQFNDPEDFKKYPITIDRDIELLEKEGCDVLFLPEREEIYPDGTELKERYDLGELENILEGAFRPGHFQGVCQVVDRLLTLVAPDQLFMGAKDYQQCMVIRKLLTLKERFSGIELVIAPIMRESSGLAMSSRNKRLSAEGLEKAALLSATLKSVRDQLTPGDNEFLIRDAEQYLRKGGFDKVDYIALADAVDLHAVKEWDGKEPVVILAAAFIEGVRLIDNISVS